MPGMPTFVDFLKATRDVVLTPKESLLHEATKNTYFLDRMLKGSGVDKTFQGGTKIVDRVLGENAGTFAFYNPNAVESPSQRQTMRSLEVPWAFARSYYPFTDEETDLNTGDPNAYKNLKRAYEQSCLVDTVNGMEDALWALPNADTMETPAIQTRAAYSLLAFNTRDGLVPASGNGGLATGSSAWTTLATVPNISTTNTWFKNKFGSYTAATPDDPDAGLIAAFDDLILQVKFDMPNGLKKYSENEGLQKMVIVTSRDGVVFYKARLRALNDRMDMLKDPAISGPQYQGIPVEYVSTLDGLGWTDNQPDYLFYNLNFVVPFFHSKWYMLDKLTDGASTQPNSHVMWKFTWYNLFPRSRRRLGRIYAA